MGDHTMTGQVTNAELQSQINRLDAKVDERHESNSQLLGEIKQKMETLIELNLGQKLQAQLIQQLGDRSKAHDEQFGGFGGVYERLGKVERATYAQGRAWKIVGTVLLVCLGGFGWLLTEMKSFYQESQHEDDRIGTLEFLVQGRTMPVLPPAQTTSGSK
jgi:hypothetical protein